MPVKAQTVKYNVENMVEAWQVCFRCSFEDVYNLFICSVEPNHQWMVPGSFICQCAAQRFTKEARLSPFTLHTKNLLFSMAGEFRSPTAWEGKLLFSLAAQQYCLPDKLTKMTFQPGWCQGGFCLSILVALHRHNSPLSPNEVVQGDFTHLLQSP